MLLAKARAGFDHANVIPSSTKKQNIVVNRLTVVLSVVL